MDIVTVTLMLSAGLLHATWHSLVKGGTSQITILAGMGVVAGGAAAVALPFVPVPTAAVWPILLMSVTVHIGYKLCLARAYELGDLGRAFPLARGMVPLFAAALALAWLGQMPSSYQSLGISLVSIGIVTLALDQLDGRARLDRRLLLAAAGAGLTVACYSVLDAYGTRLQGDWIAFTAWLVVLDSTLFLALTIALRGRVLWSDMAANRVPIVVSGILGLASFSVFLWALSRNPVGPVSALRETSVLFAGVIGVLWHGEIFSARRALGVLLIVAGIATIAY